MTENYSFLQKYIGHNDLQGIYFLPVELEEIKTAEQKLGFSFPVQLKNFYEKIGSGILSAPDGDGNIIIPPLAAVAFYKPLDDPDRFDSDGNQIEIECGSYLSTEQEDYFMSSSAYEAIQPGDLPFFDVYGGSQFFVMRPHSNNPNAVWSDNGLKVEDSFEKFIWRLYYESTTFYDAIFEADYKKSCEENE